MGKSRAVLALASVVALSAGAANAALFIVDPSPSQKDMVKLSEEHGMTSDPASVENPNDVTITTNVAANFSSGDATIKPAGTALLTDIIFTPTNPTEFGDFSFRGQDIAADQTIVLKVTDQNGATQTFDFSEGAANQDFDRQGIVAAMPGETIKSIELMDSGGFEEAKQFAFSLAAGVVPEPGVWTMLLFGVGLTGAALRASRRSFVAHA
jgi:hypothetical protein